MTTTADNGSPAEAEGRELMRQIRREELAAVKFDQGAAGMLKPRDGRELMDLANMMAGAGFMVRDIYRGNPGACAALILTCARFGLDPFATSWKTYKASKSDDAPIAYEAQLVVSMINAGAPTKGKLRYEFRGEGTSRSCKVTGVDAESGDLLVYESPPVSQIHPKNSPLWKSDPDQQLSYYSARNWCRRHYPQVLLGVYSREEVEEDRPEIGPDHARDVTPAADRLRQRAQAQRATESAAEAASDVEGIDAADMEAPAPAEASVAPQEAEIEDAEVVEEAPAAESQGGDGVDDLFERPEKE